jgi:hypothetical protein
MQKIKKLVVVIMMVLGHRAKQTKVANRKGPESSAVCA